MTKRNGKINRTLAALTAAIFSIVSLICGCAPELNNESKSEAANGEKILSGRDVSTDSPQPVNTPEKIGWEKGTIDSYIPAHESPRLDELYNSETFSKLIPKTLLLGMQLDSSYLALYDPLANPKDNRYLQLYFKTADGKVRLKFTLRRAPEMSVLPIRTTVQPIPLRIFYRCRKADFPSIKDTSTTTKTHAYKTLCRKSYLNDKRPYPPARAGYGLFSLSKKSSWSWAFSAKYGRMGKGDEKCWNAGKWIDIW